MVERHARVAVALSNRLKDLLCLLGCLVGPNIGKLIVSPPLEGAYLRKIAQRCPVRGGDIDSTSPCASVCDRRTSAAASSIARCWRDLPAPARLSCQGVANHDVKVYSLLRRSASQVQRSRGVSRSWGSHSNPRGPKIRPETGALTPSGFDNLELLTYRRGV